MSKILLDYVFQVTEVASVPLASTGYLKRAIVIAKPKAGQEANVGTLYTITNQTELAARTDNTNGLRLLSAGLTSFYLILADNLDIDAYLNAVIGTAFTVLISDDFVDSDFTTGVISPAVKASLKVQDILYTAKTAGVAGNSTTITYADTETGDVATVSVVGSDISVAIEAGVTRAETIYDAILASVPASALVDVEMDVGDEDDVQSVAVLTALAGGADQVNGAGADFGNFKGVIGVSTTSESFAEQQAVIEKRSAWLTSPSNGAENMFYAFGLILSNRVDWTSGQYATVPLNDGIESLGTAELLFEKRISFVISDENYGNRIGFFVAGGKAIIAPYIKENLKVDMQGVALQWFAANNPKYTPVAASRLQKKEQLVIDEYIEKTWLEDGTVRITATRDNFVADGYIEVPEPNAMWRVFNVMREAQ